MLKVLKLTCGKFWYLSACKKLSSSLISFLIYCKDIANLLFWELWEWLIISIKNHSINLQETFVPMCMQQISFITHFFLKILKQIANLFFWAIWACLATPKMTVSIWRNFWCLSASRKPASFFPFSLRYCKHIANFRLFPGKLMTKFFKKSKKPFLGHFGQFLPKFGKKWIFLEKKPLTVFKYFNYLPWCKSEKTNNPFLIKMSNCWSKDKQTDKEPWFYKDPL